MSPRRPTRRETAGATAGRRREMETTLVRGRGRRKIGILSTACVTVFVAFVVMTGSATAAPVTNAQAVSVEGNDADLGGFQLQAPIVIPDPLPLVFTNLTVSAKAQWSGKITTNVGWDSDKVRQGADLTVARSASPTSGTMHVTWQVSGEID